MWHFSNILEYQNVQHDLNNIMLFVWAKCPRRLDEVILQTVQLRELVAYLQLRLQAVQCCVGCGKCGHPYTKTAKTGQKYAIYEKTTSIDNNVIRYTSNITHNRHHFHPTQCTLQLPDSIIAAGPWRVEVRAGWDAFSHWNDHNVANEQFASNLLLVCLWNIEYLRVLCRHFWTFEQSLKQFTTTLARCLLWFINMEKTMFPCL